MTIVVKQALIGGVLALVFSGAQAQVTCTNENTAAPANTPTEDFTLHNDGTATHKTTGLMWMQCSLGQTWSEGDCMGSPYFYRWKNALGMAGSYSFAGYEDWRLPNRNELESIVEARCWAPCINEAIFPATPISGLYWSSSPDIFGSENAWNVNINTCTVGRNAKRLTFHARLVRAVQ